MVEHLGTIYTQAFQVWMSAAMDELGVDWPQATTGGYLEPFDTYADMRQLIEREDWGPRVRSIGYFCNVMPTPAGLPSRADTGLPDRAAKQVKANALEFLRTAMAPLWPGGVLRYPTEFRWELLVDDDESATGAARFDSQFWRANVDPSERYVLSLPGTSQYRLDAGRHRLRQPRVRRRLDPLRAEQRLRGGGRHLGARGGGRRRRAPIPGGRSSAAATTRRAMSSENPPSNADHSRRRPPSARRSSAGRSAPPGAAHPQAAPRRA